MTAPGEGAPTGFFLPRAAALHDPGWGHPDHQGRIRALTSALGNHMPVLAGRVEQREGTEATETALLRAHDEAYLLRLRQAAERAEEAGDTEAWVGEEVRVSGGSWRAAAGTAGAAVEAAVAVARGELANAFVAGRPPGHGASQAAAGGHSLLNHVAVAVRALQEAALARRVLVVDWGVHGGGGTERILGGDPEVVVLSVEEGDDGPEDVGDARDGSGPGAGRPGTPLREVVPPGTPREAYLQRFRAALTRAAEWGDPDFVLISAGLDVLSTDPLGEQALTPPDVHELVARVVEATWRGAEGRVVAVLEGGYDPPATGEGVAQALRALAGLPPAGP